MIGCQIYPYFYSQRSPVPTESPSAPPDTGRDWLSLGPASRLLGVDPDTLRRWADAGRIEAWATPGGHRRFARRSLERLAATRRRTTPLAGLGATPDRVSRAYRRSYLAPRADGAPSTAGLDDAERGAFRRDGRLLVEALLTHVDAPDPATRARAEASAGDLTDILAGRLAAAGTALPEAVAMFVAARRPFLAELGAVGKRRDLDPARLAAAYEDASALLDRLLLRLIATHQAEVTAR
jgi:excisionase family DNA binding protein